MTETQRITAKVTDTKLTIYPTILAYPHLFEPHGFDGTEPKYSCRILIPKACENLQEVLSAIQSCIDHTIEKGQEKGKFPRGKAFAGRLPLKDGDQEMNGDGEPRHSGYYYLDARSKEKPGIVDRAQNGITDQSQVYGGMEAAVVCNFYGYATPANKGVSCGLAHVMKVGEGEPMGGRISLAHAFKDVVCDIYAEDEDLLG